MPSNLFHNLMHDAFVRADVRYRNKKRARTRRIFRHVRGLRLGQSDYRYNIKSRRQRRYIRKRYR